MSNPVVRQIVLASRPNGPPKAENFRLEEFPMPRLPPGGLLLRVLYLSLDPYMRGRMDDVKSYAKSVGVGQVMTGESVCEVLASDRAGLSAGDIVLAHTGWRTHAAWDGPATRKLDPKLAPITTGLGVLGMPGFTAYAGLYLIGKPKAGDTVVVAAASGPVGSLVGQLAKMGRGGLPAAPKSAATSSKTCGSTPPSIMAPPIFRRSSRPPVPRASTSISRMSAARCGKRHCLCSTPMRACRSAG